MICFAMLACFHKLMTVVLCTQQHIFINMLLSKTSLSSVVLFCWQLLVSCPMKVDYPIHPFMRFGMQTQPKLQYRRPTNLVEIVADADRDVIVRFSDGTEECLPVRMDMTAALQELQQSGNSTPPESPCGLSLPPSPQANVCCWSPVQCSAASLTYACDYSHTVLASPCFLESHQHNNGCINKYCM